MNVTLRHTLALAAALLVLPATLAQAQEAASSPLALPSAALELSGAPVLAAPSADLAMLQLPAPDVQLAGVHYRPRRSGGFGRRVDSESVSQIHIGFFDPEGDASRQFLLGARGGPMIDPHVQLGVGVDWAHMADNVSSVSHSSNGPGGIPITTKTDLSRASTNLFPIMAFVQVSADDNMPVVPYFGAGAGYEVMNLTADNYLTGASFDATYGGWGWQVWGGAAFPLSGRARVNGELYVNTAELGRDVTDDALGGTYRETVKANGVGMRLGIAWGF
jgi:hypothetical protein